MPNEYTSPEFKNNPYWIVGLTELVQQEKFELMGKSIKNQIRIHQKSNDWWEYIT